MGGAALMAIGYGSGEDRAMQAAEQALASNLLDISIDGAKGILFNVTGGPNLSLFEINQAAALIKDTAHPDVNLIFGAVIDETMEEDIRITVIATGFEHHIPLMREITRMAPGNRRPLRETSSHNGGSRPSTTTRETAPEATAYRINDLDIPTFLRKRK
jgi:cell division protein FtsZ